MTPTAASKLAHGLQRGRGDRKVYATIEGNRIVFLGGRFGSHSLDIGVSSRERVLAHWEGYCEQSGHKALRAGAVVNVVQGSIYVARVLQSTGTRVQVTYRYRHGGETTRWLSIAEVVSVLRTAGE